MNSGAVFFFNSCAGVYQALLFPVVLVEKQLEQ